MYHNCLYYDTFRIKCQRNIDRKKWWWQRDIYLFSPKRFAFFFFSATFDIDVFAPNHILIGRVIAPPIATGVNVNH
jgi:hypothetical protein